MDPIHQVLQVREEERSVLDDAHVLQVREEERNVLDVSHVLQVREPSRHKTSKQRLQDVYVRRLRTI